MYSIYLFVFKQKTAYEMRSSDWSSDVCSSDLIIPAVELIDGVCKGAELAGVCRRRGHDELQAQIGDELGRGQGILVIHGIESLVQHHQIGRASCRERVCQYV